MYVCVTHIDNLTKIPCFIEPMKIGPSFPKIKGLNIEWWDQSQWPIENSNNFPKFYGTCDDDADTSIPGLISVLTEQEYNELHETELSLRTVEKIVPQVVTPRQARLALLQANVLTQVINTFEQLEEPLKSAAKIEWEFSTEIDRKSPLVNVMKNVLEWDDEQIDDLFISASKISTRDFM